METIKIDNPAKENTVCPRAADRMMDNAPKEMIILTETERVAKRSKEFKKLINQLVVNNLGKRIMTLDSLEPDAAWGEVGELIQKGVEVGLLHNAKRIQKLEKKIKELMEE